MVDNSLTQKGWVEMLQNFVPSSNFVAVENYGDLHKLQIDVDPMCLNRFGRIMLRLKFFCEHGRRRISKGFYAQPNGYDSWFRCPILTRAFQCIKTLGTESPPLYLSDFQDELVIPAIITKANQLKPMFDIMNRGVSRNHRFRMTPIILTPHGQINLVGRYDGRQPVLDFHAIPKLSSAGLSFRFKESELEKAFIHLALFARGATTKDDAELWQEPSAEKFNTYPKAQFLQRRIRI